MNAFNLPYDQIAHEYYEDFHVTSRNFDNTTKSYLKQLSDEIPREGLVLDLGAGRGRVNEFLEIESKRIIQVDNSIKMLSLEKREQSLLKIKADATNLPFLDSTFSVVTSFLCDPFFGLDFLHESHRVLKENGYLIFSTPSYDWGKSLRSELKINVNETRFVTKNKKEIKVPSILVKVEQISEMMKWVGFSEKDLRIEKLTIPPTESKISRDIIKSAEKQGLKPSEIDILYLAYGTKR